jgi:hypothetical protein
LARRPVPARGATAVPDPCHESRPIRPWRDATGNPCGGPRVRSHGEPASGPTAGSQHPRTGTGRPT